MLQECKQAFLKSSHICISASVDLEITYMLINLAHKDLPDITCHIMVWYYVPCVYTSVQAHAYNYIYNVAIGWG